MLTEQKTAGAPAPGVPSSAASPRDRRRWDNSPLNCRSPDPRFSQHLKILKKAGLVSEHPVGTRRIYRLNPMAVAALRDQLDIFWQRALVSYVDVAEQPTEESS